AWAGWWPWLTETRRRFNGFRAHQAALARGQALLALAASRNARHVIATRAASRSQPMSDVYTPPEVWTLDPENGGQFAGINRPTAGAREERELPLGEHPFQL